MMHDYSNQTVIVTGGAGHIGRAISEHYLAAGANVVICGRREPAQPVASAGRSAEFVQADIRDATQSQRVVDAALEKFGSIDVLINNAGGSPPVDAIDASAEFTQKIIQLNLVAPLVLSTQCAAVMRGQQTVGNIINIASVSATRPSPGTAAYGAAKAGLLSATRSLAQEWGPNVRVNAIVVGLVHHDAGVEHYGGEEGFKRVANMLPLKRMAQPPDIADACLYLSSGQASYVSGASLEVDGGGEAPVFLYLAGDNK
ncbi:MAG: SDR family oxidoreductase [Pseudomonadales bacterium]|nr:SDR family oxidoreductase [Pseudomonadales bacterium]